MKFTKVRDPFRFSQVWDMVKEKISKLKETKEDSLQ